MRDAIIGSVLTYLLWEISVRFPRMIDRLIRFAARRLPKRQRERYLEEWRAHIADTPGAAMKLWHAGGFVLAAGSMFPGWQRAIAKRRAIARERWLGRSVIRALDLAIASAAIAVLMPLLVGLALIIRRDGPAFYRQMRMGRGGRPFGVLRFRTLPMAQPGEQVAPTALGSFMRLCSLDELPQFFNVLRGDMSLVGPRPARTGSPKERPGMTGIELYSPHMRQGEAKGVRGTIKLYFKALALVVWLVLTDDGRSNKDGEF